MKSYLAKSRLVPLVLIFGMILLIFCGVLYNTQILNGSDYKARSLASNATAQTVEASRGIITDRNGKVLISNRLTYTLVFSDEEFESDTDCNDAIFRLLELCRSNNVKWTDTLPVSKEPPFTYTTPTDEGAFRKYLASEDLPAITVGTLRPTQEAPLFMAQLRKLYGVADSYSDTDARAIIGVRYPRIAANLVLSLTEYFGLPYTAPSPQPGQVSTVSGGPVNLRSAPSLQSPVTARLPDGDGVTVYGRYQDWYVVSHGEHLGYVSAPFIRLS